MKTSQLECGENHLNGFYVMRTSVLVSILQDLRYFVVVAVIIPI